MKRTILDIGNGEIIASVNKELEKVMFNINDINTDDKERKITLTLSVKPESDKKMLKITSTVKSSLRPNKKVETTLFNYMNQDKEGNKSFVLQEITNDVAPGQINFDGEVMKAPDPIVIEMKE